MKTVLSVACATLLIAAPAWAHWNPGDPYKMHYPQLPDPNGWDVNATVPLVLADDWQCTETGPVTDVHFWGSWRNDLVGQIVNAHLSIHANIAGPGFSRPGELLWSWDVEPTLIGDEPVSLQGWFDPATGAWNRPDHQLWYQYNIVNIPQPFVQVRDTIYWLDIQVTTTPNTQWGWKTSMSPHFMDDAVWSMGGTAGWQPLVDPVTGQSLDLAFVITPEPTALILLGAGALLICRRRRGC